MPIDGRRTSEDFARQNARFLVVLARKENLKQEAFVSACCIRRADSQKDHGRMGLALTVLGAGLKPAATGKGIFCIPRISNISPHLSRAPHGGLRF
jgi:hypothetical protein